MVSGGSRGPHRAVPPGAQSSVGIEQLTRVGAELSVADTMDQVVEAAVTHMASAVTAATATLMLVEGDELVMMSGHGLRPGISDTWARFSLDLANPASEAARTGREVLVPDAADAEARYPGFGSSLPAGRSLLCLPIAGRGEVIAVLGLTFEGGWLPAEAELHVFRVFAETCGQAIRRIQALDELRERAAQLTFLADASTELARSLDFRSTLANVAKLAVPMLADWCAVEVVQESGHETLAVEHTDPAKVAWAWELQRKYPTDPDSQSGTPNVIRTGVAELHAEISDDMLVAGARDEEHLRLSRELKLRSALIVPLVARDRTLGAITLIRTEGGRRYGPTDLAVAEDLGRRAGIAVDNAHLFSRAQDVALQLQRAVLPHALDAGPGWDIGTFYEPSGHTEVGGDFYDVVPLPDGRLCFALGDVMGHGVQAAADMAQIRSAIRAYLAIDPEPATVLTKLDAMFELLGTSRLVSLVYGVVEAAKNEMSLVNAGHYPPLLLADGDEPRYVQTTPRLPLGAGGDERSAMTVAFNEGQVLLLYTDGLIERRGETVDDSLARLTSVCRTIAPANLPATLSDLADRLRHDDTGDDITALAIRRQRADEANSFA